MPKKNRTPHNFPTEIVRCGMNKRNLISLITLGMLWGASFLFIRLAVPEFGAIALMTVRVALAAVVLVPLLLLRGQLDSVLKHWRAIVLMGVLHYAIPFSLFAYSMLTLSAGYSSIINASSPLFVGFAARVWLGERLNASRATGLVLGMTGVVILAWDKLAAGSGSITLAALASLLAAACYGFAAVFAKKNLAKVDPVAVAGGSMAAAALALLPLSFLVWPAIAPSLGAWGIAAVLGVVCTAAAFVLYFQLIEAIGPSRAITVTFLIPVFAVFFGAIFLSEQITTSMVAGGLIVAFGTALSTGLVDLRTLTRKTGTLIARGVGVMVVLTMLDDTPPDVHAEEWQVKTPIYVAANSFSSRTEDGWDNFATLAATAELELTRGNQPWALILFTEYHASSDSRVDGTVFTGVQGSYIRDSWDMSGFWFSSRYPDSASRQTFMTRLRYQIKAGRKVGIEYLANVDTPQAGELKLGYYRQVGSSALLKLLIGTVPSEGWHPLARLELRWRLN
jgi:drug/metabolite transporter (DMT)-like permease